MEAPVEELDLDEIEHVAQQMEAELCRDSLRDFTERAWLVVDPLNKLVPSIALDAFIAAGEAWAAGRIRRLGVEASPGVAKSIFWSVILPAWMLLKTGGTERVMSGSYAKALAERDADRCRKLIQSPWYQGLVAALCDEDEDPWEFSESQNSKDDWQTSTTGRRLCASVDGKTTGERCRAQIIDDPLSGQGADSPANIRDAVNWCFVLMATRLEDQRNGPRAMVMQPLVAGDPIDEARRRGWTMLSLPAVLGRWGVADEGCVLVDDFGVEVWRDPRKPGETLSELLDMPTLERMRSSDELGPTAFGAQYLMLRSSNVNSTFKRTYWNWYYDSTKRAEAARPAGCDTTRPAMPAPLFYSRVVITCDFKFEADKGDYASVQAWGESGANMYLLKARRGKVGYESSVAWVEDFQKVFPSAEFGIEKAANGYAVLQTVKQRIRNVKGLRPWGKKKNRHAAAVPTAENGNCFLPLGDVFEEVDEDGTVRMVDATVFTEELADATTNDDQKDSASYAILELNGIGARAPVQSVAGFAVSARPAASAPPPDAPAAATTSNAAPVPPSGQKPKPKAGVGSLAILGGFGRRR